jgi:CrcB protein
MTRLFWICLGGAAGTGARYLLSGWVLAALGPAFLYGTLAVNTVGSFESLRGGAWTIGIANVAVTVVGCLLAGAAGLAIARWWIGA